MVWYEGQFPLAQEGWRFFPGGGVNPYREKAFSLEGEPGLPEAQAGSGGRRPAAAAAAAAAEAGALQPAEQPVSSPHFPSHPAGLSAFRWTIEAGEKQVPIKPLVFIAPESVVAGICPFPRDQTTRRRRGWWAAGLACWQLGGAVPACLPAYPRPPHPLHPSSTQCAPIPMLWTQEGT